MDESFLLHVVFIRLDFQQLLVKWIFRFSLDQKINKKKIKEESGAAAAEKKN